MNKSIFAVLVAILIVLIALTVGVFKVANAINNIYIPEFDGEIYTAYGESLDINASVDSSRYSPIYVKEN